MRHHDSVRKFGREKNQRQALMRSLARNLIRDSRIKTTVAKAKELRPYVEKLVTKAQNDTIATRRLINMKIHGTKETNKLIEEIAPKYKDRKGGYTRIMRVENRGLDGSQMALIEFV